MIITWAGFWRGIAGGVVGSLIAVVLLALGRMFSGVTPVFDVLVSLMGLLIGGFVGTMWITGGFGYLFRDHPPFNWTKPGFWRAVLAGGAGTTAGIVLTMILRLIQQLDPVNIAVFIVIGLIGGIIGLVWGAGAFSGAALPKGPKPGLARAIPASILAFILSAFLVFVVRSFQEMEPRYDPRVTLVIAPFMMAAAVVWGMGGFDPRMSEHAHPPEATDGETAIVPAPEHAYEEDKEVSYFGIFSSQLWTVTTLTLLLVAVFFGFALLPTGLLLETTSDPAASMSKFATNMEFMTPLGIEINGTSMVQADKLSVFAGFIIFTVLSLLVFGGGIGFLFYWLNRGVNTVRGQRSTSLEDPENYNTWWIFLLHVPLRFIRLSVMVFGAISGNIGRALRRGIPAFFQR